MKRLAILASYNGTILEPILEAVKHKKLPLGVALIISNNTNAAVLKKAKKYNIAHALINTQITKDPDSALFDILKKESIDIVLLAGYMKKIPASLTQNFFILNSHPALLPSYGGKGMYGRHVHEAVINNREKESGVTLHRVNEAYDEGAIILQKSCLVSEDETVESLEAKVKQLEKKAVIEALELCLK